jgi:hypothetical protein
VGALGGNLLQEGRRGPVASSSEAGIDGGNLVLVEPVAVDGGVGPFFCYLVNASHSRIQVSKRSIRNEFRLKQLML